MKKIFKYGMIVLLSALVSCESWLDVPPTDRSSAKDLYSSREGFLKALNGVYIELNNRDIYGCNMGTMLDLMAQYYVRTSASGSAYEGVGRYNYGDDKVKAVFEPMWEKSYNLIVSLNVIINQCGESNSHLTGIWHGLVKGEAVALRAFLHFDMLRLFGPVYSDNPEMITMPYVTNTDQMVSPLLTAKQIGELLIKDLTEAIALLKDIDPIITEGRLNSAGADGDNSLRYRQYRMNYYAARAVLARVHMWLGDHKNAYTVSTELLKEAQPAGNEIFPFVTSADATNASIPDRLFSTEAMFAIYDNRMRQSIHDFAFAPLLEDMYILKFFNNGNDLAAGRISELYNNPDDYRYKLWFNTYLGTTGNKTVHFFQKFNIPVGGTALAERNKLETFRYMHPLIRITEVYLIAAESCLSHKADLAESKSYLNKIRAGRNVADLAGDDATQLKTNIEAEFRRELLGDGQMFFYYKRLNNPSIPNGSAATGFTAMTIDKYIVPLPDSEKNERESINDN